MKILLALFLLLILTGCSPTGSRENLIKKKPVTVTLSEGNSNSVVQLGNGTYIYHDREYPGL
ncbi:MAG: hypothetical protein WCF95_02430 [bacterium]